MPSEHEISEGFAPDIWCLEIVNSTVLFVRDAVLMELTEYNDRYREFA